MKSLILYSTIVGGFYAQNETLDKAIAAARVRVGGDTWKRGYSAKEATGATAAANLELKQANIEPVQFEGELIHVGFVENKDGAGNTYPKLRVGVRNATEELLMSVDLKGDVAQRLMVKLDNCQPGDHIRVSAWPTMIERGGRQYINHAVSMKNAEGVEVPANSAFSAEVKVQTEGVEVALKAAGIDDKKVIANAKVTKRVAAHKELLLKIESRFVKADFSEH
jgi:hypothetical protein